MIERTGFFINPHIYIYNIYIYGSPSHGLPGNGGNASLTKCGVEYSQKHASTTFDNTVSVFYAHPIGFVMIML